MHPTKTIHPPVLLLENHDRAVLLMRRAFTEAFVQNPLFAAYTAQHAAELITSGTNPCLFIININSPALDGFALLTCLQNQPDFRQTPKLVISPTLSGKDLLTSLNLGATACFIKPDDITALTALVRQWKDSYIQAPSCVSPGKSSISPGSPKLPTAFPV